MKLIISFRKRTLFFLVILFVPGIVLAQIQGSVHNIDNTPLPFANVMLLNQKDSSVVTGMMATDEGIYSLTNFRPGTYIIGVSMLGYKPAYSPPFIIVTSKDHRHNNPIYVEADTHQLEDVDVVAKKPVYELKIDRMVVNVENSITSTGNTALEVLEKSPGIIVDRQNGTISMAGKGGVMVIINGKQNRMPLAAAVQMLDGMSADNVKHIELITTPPSKYDAEGDAGIINIVLKKNENFGTNGSFSLGAGIGQQERFNGDLNLNHHVEKVNFFGLYSASYNNLYQVGTMYNSVLKSGSVFEKDTETLRDADVSFQNARLGFDYTISSKTILGVLFAGYRREFNKVADNETFYRTDGQLTEHSTLVNPSSDIWKHGMGNINLQHFFREDEKIDVNLDYLKYDNKNPSYYKIESEDESGNTFPGEEIDATKSTPITIYVGTLDYSGQLGTNLKLEAGIKGTVTRFMNDVGVSYLDTGVWRIDDELTNNYSLNENISAAYTSVNYKISDKSSIVAGLRYEYMNSVLDSETEKRIVDLHYGKFFPTVYYSNRLNENGTLQFSYSKRIDRPSINQLAPFVLLLTPETFVIGNEKLLPAISHILKTDYQYKTVIFSVSYTNTQDAISRFQPKYDEETDRQYYTSQNLDHQNTISAMISIPVKVAEWWKMQNNFNWIWQRVITNYEGEELDITQSNYRVNTIQSFTLIKRFTAEISGFYQSKSLSGITTSRSVGRLDVGVQYKFKNENSRLNLNVIDVFHTNLWRLDVDIPELNLKSNSKLDFDNRYIKLTFSHSFGNNAVKVRKRNTGSEEEQKRITN